MFQKLKQKLQFFNNVYMDYFLINSLLSLILFKLNKITFQISFIYLFIGILLFVSILNFIENQYIFTSQNIKENQLENMNFNSIQKILNIKNTNFNRNQNLFYIQKRYLHFT